MITRRMVLGGLLAGAAGPVWAELAASPRPVARPGRGAPPAWPPASASGEIERLIEAARLGGTVSFVVADARSGEVLAAREPEALLPPASVAKALTALYALDRLGPEHRFATRVLATGPVRGGMVEGDLVLAGGGDPNLQTDQLGDLVARLAARGIRGATGRLRYWDGALPVLRGIAADLPVHVGYNAALSGLNLNFNRVHFAWERAGGDWQVTVDARGARFVPPVEMVRVAVAARQAPLFTFEAGRVEAWTVAASALGDVGSRWLPVREPGAYAAEVFRTLARAQGMRLAPGGSIGRLPAGQEIDRVESEPLIRILRDMLRFSTNITAECVGLAASRAGGLDASARAMSDWVRGAFGVAVDLRDHSGLGGASRMTAAGMAQVLAAAAAGRRGLVPILRDVGMRNDEGRVIEGHAVRVPAKSGTLNFVSGLAGHVVPPAGRELVFAIFTGDPARRDAVPVAERERPEGSAAWTRRARRLQGQLVRRWAGLHA